MTPLVSVVMPVYNGEKYLKQAIDSVLAQTYADYEFIIVNDGSTDSSLDVIVKFNDARIKLIHQSHSGAAASYNMGFQNAIGKYIIICDQDDISRDDRIEKQFRYLENNRSIDLVGSYYNVINKNDEILAKRTLPKTNDEIHEALYYKVYSIFNPTVCIRRLIFNQYGYFKPEYSPSSDYEFYLRLSNKVIFENIGEYLYSWRKHDGSISSELKYVSNNTEKIALAYLEKRKESIELSKYNLLKAKVYYYSNKLLRADYYFLLTLLKRKYSNSAACYLLKSILFFIPIKILRLTNQFDSKVVTGLRSISIDHLYEHKTNFIVFWQRFIIFSKNVITTIESSLFKRVWNINSQHSNGILLVNTQELGDLVLSIDLIKSICSNYENMNVYLLLKNEYVEFMNQFGLSCTIIEWDKRKYKWDPFYKIKILRYINSLGLEVSYNISKERGILSDDLVLQSGSKNKICFQKHSSFLRPFFEKYNNKQYSSVINPVETNEYKKLTEILYKLDIKKIPRKMILFNVSIKRQNIEGRYLVIAPNSSDPERTWGLKNYSHLIMELSKQIKVVVVGSNENKTQVDTLIKNDKNIINLYGLTDLLEISNLVYNCVTFIGNDSGLTHLAKYFNKPLVAIIGGGMYGRFFPDENDGNTYLYHQTDCFGCGWNCIKRERICLTEVPFEAVYKACMQNIQ